MKKVQFIFLAVTIFGAVAVAQEYTHFNWGAGLEFGIADRINGEDTLNNTYIRPMLFFHGSNIIFYGAEFYMEIGIPFGFNNLVWYWWDSSAGVWRRHVDDLELWLGVDLTLRGTQHLHISHEGMLSAFMESQTVIVVIGDDVSDEPPVYTPAFRWGRSLRHNQSRLIPGLRYTHTLDDFSIFGQIAIPFLLLHGDDHLSSFDFVDLDFAFGIKTAFGFGLEVEINNIITRPWMDADFFRFLTVTPSYENGPFYAEVEFRIPTFEDGMDNHGMIITPEIRYLFNNFQAFLNFSFRHIGSDWMDTRTDIGMGFRVTF